jgi:hypothetical protein
MVGGCDQLEVVVTSSRFLRIFVEPRIIGHKSLSVQNDLVLVWTDHGLGSTINKQSLYRLSKRYAFKIKRVVNAACSEIAALTIYIQFLMSIIYFCNANYRGTEQFSPDLCDFLPRVEFLESDFPWTDADNAQLSEFGSTAKAG